MKRPNNLKKRKKGTDESDIGRDMDKRVQKELRQLGFIDNMNCLLVDIDIEINVKDLKQEKKDG